jgi:dipeptidyl aminopeptidase/acylaminoacyl peptidase
MQTDVSDGLEALAKSGIVDSRRACIVGASYGGYAALAGVTVQNGLYRCAVSVAGVSDPVYMLETEMAESGARNAGVRYWRAFLGADQPGWVAELNAVSPAKLAARADAPVLLIHGKDDTVVKIEQSRRMERALRSAGKPVEMLTLDGEDHGLSGETTRIAMLQASVTFVLKHNPPD